MFYIHIFYTINILKIFYNIKYFILKEWLVNFMILDYLCLCPAVKCYAEIPGKFKANSGGIIVFLTVGHTGFLTFWEAAHLHASHISWFHALQKEEPHFLSRFEGQSWLRLNSSFIFCPTLHYKYDSPRLARHPAQWLHVRHNYHLITILSS